MESKNWLVIGIPENWELAFNQPIPLWGLKPSYKVEFQAMNIGDLLWFYVTSPIKGVIGAGVVKDKYIDNVTLTWKEEWVKKQVVWPLRFRIQVLKVLSYARWKDECVRINDFNLFWQRGLHLLSDMQGMEIFKRTKTVFAVADKGELFTSTTIVPLPVMVQEQPPLYLSASEGANRPFTHKTLQETIAEIGKLQSYFTELEYSVDLPGGNKNLDVVWKREVEGVPTFAFEIELSGMVERAVDRLRFAFRKWNSRPRIIISPELVTKAYNTISASDREFSQQIKIYEPDQVVDLLKQKQGLKQVEQNLGLY
ncbi:MAG: hypothetical protein COX46_02445 [bacterium (Candidatus Ratteibacteria) CG23_combo_of_CG06-09_8_20_14_all_48_7]|uniref:EVE domain-containing protein n=1 Tax=bacterium (Candidatus Ratteibacteria) CG23_combo_of_CG06-09_8_20_14_all_48_7 TaxID=2014292 RepID=A0A2G9YAZ2_9BACT|nr:MAG: hypothetical protein COX46_02445 [bacterium (Candidatus Ratteibacteria) CG23_combo_of_CG06-09_8_20_14_all_48_7]